MDSNVNIRAYDARHSRTRRIASLPAAERDARNRASRVDSIPPTQESVDLLTCLEEWNNNQLPEELKKRTGGLTKKLEDRQFPTVLLHVLVEYMLATCVQLVLSSTCPHLEERCHFGLTRRFGISLDTDIRDVLYSFLYVHEFALTATDTQGKLHDFSVLSRLPARNLPVFCEREIHLQVQAKLEFSHICAACGDRFRCIPQGYPPPADCVPPPDNSEGCECHRFEQAEQEEDRWFCSNACYLN